MFSGCHEQHAVRCDQCAQIVLSKHTCQPIKTDKNEQNTKTKHKKTKKNETNQKQQTHKNKNKNTKQTHETHKKRNDNNKKQKQKQKSKLVTDE